MLVKVGGKDTETVTKNAGKLPQELYKSLSWGNVEATRTRTGCLVSPRRASRGDLQIFSASLSISGLQLRRQHMSTRKDRS
jgi:hypothetical protein